MAEQHFVVQTHPAHEAYAHGHLTDAGWAAHLFVTREEYRIRGVRRTVMAPLFPTYLFVAFDLADLRWRKIASVRGVKKILGADALKPTALPFGALDDLKARYAAGEFAKQLPRGILEDDTVAIRSGPFQGHIGICTESRGERIKVLLRILGGEREVPLPARIVERVGA